MGGKTKQKLAGILVPLFALRHDQDFGIGDTKAMRDAIDFCAQNSIAVLQILPINETGGDNSPYNAISSVALDPIYLELTPNSVPGLTAEILGQLAPESLLQELRQGSVHYPRVRRLKGEILVDAFAHFSTQATEAQKSSLAQFEEQNHRWLEPYTLFRTLIDRHAGSSCWPTWEQPWQSFVSSTKHLEDSDVAASIAQTRRFWSYVQWIAYTQWRQLKQYATDHCVSLMGDLPFGVSRYSADVWSEQSLFDMAWSCGAPPESYFQGDRFVREWGQNWGMPVYDWQAHKKENFTWWRQRVKHLNELFHYFRIDHVLGFFRVYAFPWIPERNQEFTELTKEEAMEITGGLLPHFIPRADELPEDAESNAKEGKEIMRVLIDAAGSTGIVAEDLGMVPDYVRPLLTDLGIPGFTIPIFERDEETREFKPKETLPPLNLTTYGTHDHQPVKTFYDGLVEWWRGPQGHAGWLELQRLMRFLGEDENNPPPEFNDELHRVMLRVLLETPCWLAVLMITDLLGTAQRFNEPGLSGDYNWSQRLDRELSEYAKDPEFGGKISYFRGLIQKTKRSPLVSAGRGS